MMSLAVIFLLAFSCCKGSQYQGYWETPFNSQQYYPAPTAPTPPCPFMMQAMMPTHGFTDSYFSSEQSPRSPSPSAGSWTWSSLASPQPQRRTQGCRGCGPGCVAHCSCPEMAGVRWAMAMGLPAEEVLRIGAHPLRNHK